MNKLYNTEMLVVKGLSDFFESIDFKFSKPQAKMVPHIIISIINAENVTTLNVILTILFFLINHLLKRNYQDFSIIINLMI
jgi:hypothetical protein